MNVTLITGCGTGIGRATALHLARQGYYVFAGVINTTDEHATSLAEIVRSEKLPMDIIQLDVTDAEACEKTVNKIIEQAGKIDVLINNAGIGDGGPLEEVSEERVRKMFEVNLLAPMRLMRLVVPHMRKAKSGAIVNMASIMGRLARAGGSAYAATKFGLEAASEALAQEVRRFNIRVVLIEPGVVKTPLHDGEGPAPDPNAPYYEFDVRGDRLFGTLLKNPSYPEDVAEIIQHAIETDTPKLRYLVGEDAKKWLAGRQGMTDEEWVDVGREMTLKEYVQLYREKFDMEI